MATTTFGGTSAIPRVIRTREGCKDLNEDVALRLKSPQTSPIVSRVSPSSASPNCSTRLFFPSALSSKGKNLKTQNIHFVERQHGGCIPRRQVESPTHDCQQSQNSNTFYSTQNDERRNYMGPVPIGAHSLGAPCPVIKSNSIRSDNETDNDLIIKGDISNRLSTWHLKDSTCATVFLTTATATTTVSSSKIIDMKRTNVKTTTCTSDIPELVYEPVPYVHKHMTRSCIRPLDGVPIGEHRWIRNEVHVDNVVSYHGICAIGSICSLTSAPRASISNIESRFSTVMSHGVSTDHELSVDGDVKIRRTRAKRKYVYNPKPIMKRPNAQLHDRIDGRDEEYWRHREYNNAAARRSRSNRRAQEIETMEQTRMLKAENQRLNDRVKELEKMNEELKSLVRKDGVTTTTSV